MTAALGILMLTMLLAGIAAVIVSAHGWKVATGVAVGTALSTAWIITAAALIAGWTP